MAVLLKLVKSKRVKIFFLFFNSLMAQKWTNKLLFMSCQRISAPLTFIVGHSICFLHRLKYVVTLFKIRWRFCLSQMRSVIAEETEWLEALHGCVLIFFIFIFFYWGKWWRRVLTPLNPGPFLLFVCFFKTSSTQPKIHIGAQGEQQNDAEGASFDGSSGRGQVSAEKIRWRRPPSRSPRPRRHSAAAASLLLPLEPPAFRPAKSNPLRSRVCSPTVELPYGCWPLRQGECR